MTMAGRFHASSKSLPALEVIESKGDLIRKKSRKLGAWPALSQPSGVRRIGCLAVRDRPHVQIEKFPHHNTAQ